MDLIKIFTASIVGIPLVFLVFCAVEFMKRMKNQSGEQAISGNGLLVFSLIWGLAIGGLYMVAQTRPPAGDWWIVFVYWFGVIIYGLALGFLASLFYDVLKALVEKLIQKQLESITARLKAVQ